MDCTLPYSDISSIGVRSSQYAQNLFCFVPAILALWDGTVRGWELLTARSLSTTIILSAFSSLITALIQALTHGLSSFHLAIILHISWMNNTSMFIYLLLCIQYGNGVEGNTGSDSVPTNSVEPGLPDRLAYLIRCTRRHLHIDLRLPGVGRVGGRSEHRNTSGPFEKSQSIQEDSPTQEKVSTPESASRSSPSSMWTSVIMLGSLHMSLMAGIGIWLWHDPRSFDILSSGDTCSYDTLSIAVFGRLIRLSSVSLQRASVGAYCLFLIPGLNLILPLVILIAVFIITRFVCQRLLGISEPGSVPPVIVGLVILLAINVIFLIDVEIAFRSLQSKSLVGGGWTFGQTLSLLNFSLPMRDIIDLILVRWRHAVKGGP